MREDIALSRSGESGLFGKADIAKTINLSEATDLKLSRIAASFGVPVGEYVRSLIDAHVWGVSEVLNRSCTKSVPFARVEKQGE